jgi:hypothetical protein
MLRLRCSEGGFGLWLGDKGIVNGKTSTSTYILTVSIGVAASLQLNILNLFNPSFAYLV